MPAPTFGSNSLATQYTAATTTANIQAITVAASFVAQAYLYAAAQDANTRYARAFAANPVGFVNAEFLFQFVADGNTDTGSDAAIISRVQAIWPYLAYGY